MIKRISYVVQVVLFSGIAAHGFLMIFVRQEFSKASYSQTGLFYFCLTFICLVYWLWRCLSKRSFQKEWSIYVVAFFGILSFLIFPLQGINNIFGSRGFYYRYIDLRNEQFQSIAHLTIKDDIASAISGLNSAVLMLYPLVIVISVLSILDGDAEIPYQEPECVVRARRRKHFRSIILTLLALFWYIQASGY